MKNFSSCIYSGIIFHKRFKPKINFFTYRVFSLFIDLKELNKMNYLKIFSHNFFNVLSFYDKDHGPRDGSDLETWVRRKIKKAKINQKINSIKILCFPRIFGYVFNPLSIFYCFNTKGNIVAILYEVKNTYDEQHTYIFSVKTKSKIIKQICNKKMYVSPFIKIKTKYHFYLSKPDKQIEIFIKQTDSKGELLNASQKGKKIKLNDVNLIKEFLKHPLMTFKVILAIHFEALILWMKGIKLVKKTKILKNNVSYEKYSKSNI